MTQASVKLIAFDLDGTLSQHRSTPPPESFALLDELSKDCRLLMVGAGACERIHRQMNHYPIDIIGNYGMQTARFNRQAGCLELVDSSSVPADREAALRHAQELRRMYGWEDYTGDTIEFHPSGMLTFPLLGTKAAIEDKLAADPTRKIRQAALDEVRQRFTGYTVFVGGSSISSTSGWITRARARATRCCCPPDSLSGMRLAKLSICISFKKRSVCPAI